MSITISELIMYSTLKIKRLDSSGNSTGSGTGFLMSFCKSGNHFIPALVTNRHVLKDTASIELSFTLKKENGDPDIGKVISVKITTEEKIFHPDPKTDLAVLPIAAVITACRNNGTPIFCPFIGCDLIPNESNWESFDVLERVVMAGYPYGYCDTAHNFPIFRSGFTATHPQYDFNGKSEFLVDLPCFHGCSGSPVYLMGDNIYSGNVNLAKPVGSTRFHLVGVLYGGPQFLVKGTVKTESGPIDNAIIETPSSVNLGCVIKSSNLLVFESILSEQLTSAHHVAAGIGPFEQRPFLRLGQPSTTCADSNCSC